MAYEKQTWETGDTITAAKLNNMENGIAAVTNLDIVFSEFAQLTDEEKVTLFDSALAILDSGGNVTIDMGGAKTRACTWTDSMFSCYTTNATNDSLYIMLLTIVKSGDTVVYNIKLGSELIDPNVSY